jgi:hypothetical protein
VLQEGLVKGDTPHTLPACFSSCCCRFLCDASSLAFLAEHGFDFNTCIKEGVPYMPLRTRDWQLMQVNRGQGTDS